MGWRLAKSLEVLRGQVNAKWPKRSKASDGTIGNAEHSSRTSDHNPNEKGVVCAIDLTHDPKTGFDSYAFAELLRANKDKRIKYIISNYKICSGAGEKQPAWVWRPYKVPPNKNPHDHHVHISVKGNYDSTDLWKFDAKAMPDPVPAIPTPPKTIRLGSKGSAVEEMQRLLDIKADGIFGIETEDVLKKFQKTKKLVPDGICGPQTWYALKTITKGDH